MPPSATVVRARLGWRSLALVSTCAWTLFAATPGRAQQRRWTLGSPASLVQSIQGKPDLVERLASFGFAAWHFGDSWVRFGFSDNRVIGWSNAGELKVELRAGADTTRNRVFGKGSARDDLLRIEGTPAAIVAKPDLGEQQFRYGRAVVRLGARDGRVRSWDDPDGVLHTGTGSHAAPAHPRPAAPASLTATATFADDGGDGVFDAEEHATISLAIHNSGKGTAYGVELAVTSTPASAITIVSAAGADSIPAGGTVVVSAMIAGALTITDGQMTLHTSVRELNGFDLDPAPRLTVKTRAFRAPRFALDGVGIVDQSGNGRIEPREIVDVTVRIVNRGTGDAHVVRATVKTGTGVLLTPESASDVAIGTLRAGDTRDLHFTAFTNSRAVGFPVSVVLHEMHARFDTTLVLPLGLDRPIASVPDLVVRGREPAAHPAPPPLIVDVDSGVPRSPVHRNTVAVVLGVERYQRIPAAEFARHDAAVFREYAASLFGTGDDASHLFFRTDDEVTGGELHKVFGDGGWLARRVDAQTDVIIYFAGHGVADLKTHAPYLLPNDGDPNYPVQTGYALNELYEQLAALGAHSVTVFVDACFSGGTRGGGSLFAGARDVVVSVEHPALRSETMSVFTASSADQLASTAPDRQHGLFTYWLLKGLRGGADADLDKRVSVGELDRYLHANVPADAAKQDREQVPFTVSRSKTRTIVERR